MDLFFALGNTFFGVLMVLIGFKIYNPFRNEPERAEQWYKKFGIFFKIGGIFILGFGLLQTVLSLT